MKRSRTKPSAIDSERLLSLVGKFAGIRVAVFGDLLADEFIYGQISRVSREAPVLILEYDSSEIVPGGAGNAANNVAALGGSATAIGVAGDDETGQRLLDVLAPRVDVRGVVRPAGYRTPTKTRILAGGIHSAKQQVVRIDRAARPTLTDADRHNVEVKLIAAAAICDALLVSDYGTGLVTPDVVSHAQRRFKGPGRRQPPVLVDSRYSLLRYHGMTTCTPNESEVEHLFGIKIGEDLKLLDISLAEAGRRKVERFRDRAPAAYRGAERIREGDVFAVGKEGLHRPWISS